MDARVHSPLTSTKGRNSALETFMEAAANAGTATSRRPYSLSHPKDGKSYGLPSTAMAAGTLTTSLVGAWDGVGAKDGETRQPASWRTQSMGSWRMRTEEV